MASHLSAARGLWHSVARSFSSAFVVEAASPKISGVTALDTLKNLSLVEFVHTSYYLYDTIAGLPGHKDCVPLGKTLLELMTSVLGDRIVRANTCLGYGLTAISLASSIFYSLSTGPCSDPIECVLAGYDKLEECAETEHPDNLLKSIDIVNPSYHGQYYSQKTLENVLELLLDSAPWDLVAYNIVNRFSVTLDLYMRIKSTPASELARAVGGVYRYAASKYIDSISFKSGGVMLSRLVQEIASNQAIDDREARDIIVGQLGVNLGSISDLVASSLALELIAREWGAPT